MYSKTYDIGESNNRKRFEISIYDRPWNYNFPRLLMMDYNPFKPKVAFQPSGRTATLFFAKITRDVKH